MVTNRVPLLTALERKTQAHQEDGETPVQTDALLYVSHTLLMVGILEEICPLQAILICCHFGHCCIHSL